MIYGKLESQDNYNFLLGHPIWAKAFSWLKSMPTEPTLGIHPVLGDEMFVNIMRYDTVQPEQSRFETHRKYIDLQYTIAGCERIAWATAESLTMDGDYNAEKDLQFYSYQKPVSLVEMSPGSFSIYYPSDAHLPKIHDGRNANVFKLVIKIGRHLVD